MDRAEIAAALGREVTTVTPVAGGDVNRAYRIELAGDASSDGAVFVKWQDAALPGLFAAEAAGLDWLRAGPLRVPRVLAHGAHWIALEWLALDGAPEPRAFGDALARLHQLGAPRFGLDAPNYLATLPQDNAAAPDWPTFYVERRLRPLCTRARLGPAVDRQLDALRARPELFGPPEPPARLHGDLWWGNAASCAGAPAIFDPAVYGGHREVDLAMLALFGALPDALIAAYERVVPLAAGWRDRIALHQLYPLAAHACLFGGSYGPRLARSLAAML